jgi:CRP/FNR family transcriptional regulator, anaerobic regulatory protein
MDSQQTTFVHGSRQTLLRRGACPAPDETKVARFVETICAEGDWLHLHSQQRVPIPPAGKVIVLREGILAIDAMPATGKLQVLDFVVAGDVVSASTVLPAPGVSLRAITNASLVSLDPPSVNRTAPADEYWTFLVAQCLNQMARINIHQLMIGRLETEARVASFILALALRNIRKDAPEIFVRLPMSRTDIANYLVINCDTLSRTMMRFCNCGLIKRESRHAIRVFDLEALRKKSPLASLMSALFEKGSCQPRMDFGGHGERNATQPLVCENGNRDVIPLVAQSSSLSPSNPKYPWAASAR